MGVAAATRRDPERGEPGDSGCAARAGAVAAGEPGRVASRVVGRQAGVQWHVRTPLRQRRATLRVVEGLPRALKGTFVAVDRRSTDTLWAACPLDWDPRKAPTDHDATSGPHSASPSRRREYPWQVRATCQAAPLPGTRPTQEATSMWSGISLGWGSAPVGWVPDCSA